jgi:proteasome accessory factor A
MSARRVMGTETEYGISVPGNPGANAMLISSQVVNAYAGYASSRARRARWDFEEENPLRDARGFDLARDLADASQLTDEDMGLANVILTNGARLYVDHAHPEYSGPEVTNPRDAVLWDKAGERIMARASELAAMVPGSQHISLLQEQHRQQGRVLRHARELPHAPRDPVRRHRAPPHAVLRVRQVVTGAGRVGSGRTAAARASRSASAPTSSRSRSVWRRRSSGRSSTPVTSRTPTRRSTAGCT